MPDQYPAPLSDEELRLMKLSGGMTARAPVGAATEDMPAPDVPITKFPGSSTMTPAPLPRGQQQVSPYEAPASPTTMAPPVPPPKWADYEPKQPHGLARVGHVLADFNPASAALVNRIPYDRAKERYAAATGEWQRSQTVPVMTSTGQVVYLPPASAEKMLQTQTQEAGKNTRTGETTTSQQKVQEMKGQTAEDIQGSKSETAKDVQASKSETALDIAGGKAKYTTLTTPDGKTVPGKEDPKGNLLLADGTPAPKGTIKYTPPTYGQTVGGRIISLIDPDTELPTDYQVGAGGTLTRLGVSGTGTPGSRIAQAGAIERSGTDLIADINTRRDKVGNIGAIIESAFLSTPLADPEQSYLAARLGSFAALQPALHGFRGQQAMQEFIKLIGGIPKDADALIRAIQGIQTTAGEVAPPKPKTPTGGTTELERGPDGKLRAKAKAK